MSKSISSIPGEVESKDVYAALIQLVIHSESISWDRFYSFLTGNSILVLAWAALFSSPNHTNVMFHFVMICIAALGILGGIAWHSIGIRGRTFLNEYMALGSSFENKQRKWPFGDEFKLMNRTEEIRISLKHIQPRSYQILTVGPVVFIVLYSILLAISLIRIGLPLHWVFVRLFWWIMMCSHI